MSTLVFPLPAPGSVPKREPVAWNADHPYQGLGFREIHATHKPVGFGLTEYPVIVAGAAP